MPRERVHTLKERALHPLRKRGGSDIVALRDVSFSVEPGEFFGIVGRNGSGKSTLLKCLGGIYAADRGRIAVRGRMSTFIELGVGFNPDLAAADNIVINGIMLGLTPREARRRVDDVLAFAELERFADLKLKNYSSGMQVRLAFSTMIQVNADVLLIDEVLAVGDASFQQKCFQEFERLRAERRTILFVTHDMGAVTRFCDRAILIERGTPIDIGPPRDIARQYFEANFGENSHTHISEATAPIDAPVHFGTGQAEIADAWFEDGRGNKVDTIEQGKPAQFVAAVRIVEAMDEPTFGFSLNTEDGVPVFATSTRLEGMATGSFAAGELVG